jgi:hypothetical protein
LTPQAIQPGPSLSRAALPYSAGLPWEHKAASRVCPRSGETSYDIKTRFRPMSQVRPTDTGYRAHLEPKAPGFLRIFECECGELVWEEQPHEDVEVGH